jgi:hypothetical protein
MAAQEALYNTKPYYTSIIQRLLHASYTPLTRLLHASYKWDGGSGGFV